MRNTLSRPILLTCFGPFDRWPDNSSLEGARLVAARDPVRLDLVELTVDHASAAAELAEALDARRPEVALLIGQTSEDRFRLERRARTPEALPWPGGPSERHGAWPFEASLAAMTQALSDHPGSARLSDDCGRYVCETVYRTVLDRRAQTPDGPRLAVFLHTPPLSERWTPERVAEVIDAALAGALSAIAAHRAF